MLKSKIALFLMLSTSVFGEVFNGPTDLSLKHYDSLSINGPAKLKLVRTSSIEIHGPLEFKSLDVSGKAEIMGTLKGEKGKFGQLKVTGFMDVNHVICNDLSVKGSVTASYLDVKNQADIIGTLNAKESKFKNLAVTADKTLLEDSVLDSITIRKGSKNEILILKGSTAVNGDIVFESGNGVVQIEGPGVQIKGLVKGASVKK